MFTIHISSKGFSTHIVEETGELKEVTGSKNNFKNLEVFETYIATTYPYFQVPMDRKLINAEDHIIPMIASGPLSEPIEEITEPAVHPVLTSELFDKPTQEEINKSQVLDLTASVEDVAFEETPQTISINPLNSSIMNETKQEPQAQATMEPQPQVVTPPTVQPVPFGKKVQWYSAVGAGHVVVGVTGPTHFILQSAADVLQAAANGVAFTEAYAIDKLKIAEESQAEIQAAVLLRTRKYQAYATAPVRAVKGAASMISMMAQSDIAVTPTLNPQS